MASERSTGLENDRICFITDCLSVARAWEREAIVIEMATLNVIDSQDLTGIKIPEHCGDPHHSWRDSRAYYVLKATSYMYFLACEYAVSNGSGGIKPCPNIKRVRRNLIKQGFVRPDANKNRRDETKVAVLRAIREAGEGAIFRQILLEATPQLTEGQVRGCLKRLAEAKQPCILRTETPLLPYGSGFKYSLTRWGELVLDYFERHGY